MRNHPDLPIIMSGTPYRDAEQELAAAFAKD